MKKDLINVIENRVSCRSYSNKKVSNSKIMQIAQCGKMAPSAKNRQIANITIIKDKRNVEKLRKLSLDVLNRDCFYGANVMILVHAPKDDMFCIQDCSCILENMFIAATVLDVNSCWINQVNDLFATPAGQLVKKSFKIPSDAMVVGTCVLGYSDDNTALKVKDRKEDFIKTL